MREGLGLGMLRECVVPSMLHASVLELFALLSMGHFLADFSLQGDRMAVEKCPGRDVTLSWQWWLAAHAAVHGLIVALLAHVA